MHTHARSFAAPECNIAHPHGHPLTQTLSAPRICALHTVYYMHTRTRTHTHMGSTVRACVRANVCRSRDPVGAVPGRFAFKSRCSETRQRHPTISTCERSARPPQNWPHKLMSISRLRINMGAHKGAPSAAASPRMAYINVYILFQSIMFSARSAPPHSGRKAHNS